MKVGCERCGASYSVADEKVAGRKLRLRCKKCGEGILIDSASPDAARAEMIEEGEATPENLSAPTVEADASWYVEIDGNAQGPFVFEEVAAQLEQGRITLDTLVYGVDFTDWRAASTVPELKARAVPPPVPAAATTAAATKSARNAQDREPTVEVPLSSFGYSMGSDPFEDPESKPSPALSPRVSAAEMMTVGLQREGTVQFSVDQIRALSSVSSPSTAPIAPVAQRPGFASGDGSGLIDIRSFGEAPPPEEGYRSITGMMGSPLDTIAPLTLPTSMPRSSGVDLRTKVLAGLAAMACIAAGGVAALALTRQPQQGAPLAATALAAAPVAAAALPTAAPAAAAELVAEKPAAEEPAAAAAEPAAEEPAPAQERASAPRRAAGAIKAKAAAAPRAPRAEPEERAAAKPAAAKSERSTIDIDDLLAGKGAKAEKPKAKGGDSIDDLLESAVAGKSAPAKQAEPEAKNSGLPATPSRDEVKASLGAAKAKTAKCKGPGVAIATIKIGGNGKVSSVTVSGVEGAAKSCVENAVKSTAFPKSQKDVFEVKFPFSLK